MLDCNISKCKLKHQQFKKGKIIVICELLFLLFLNKRVAFFGTPCVLNLICQTKLKIRNKILLHHMLFIFSHLWLTSHPRGALVLLDTGTPGTTRGDADTKIALVCSEMIVASSFNGKIQFCSIFQMKRWYVHGNLLLCLLKESLRLHGIAYYFNDNR